jgi:hypothetical protein
MMLISPNKKRQAVTQQSATKKKPQLPNQEVFNDEANVIERTQSRKVFEPECLREMSIRHKEGHVHSRRYKENIIKMIQRRRPGQFELNTVEDTKKLVYLLGNAAADESMEVKSSLMIDEEIELRDGEFSRSQSSIHTLDLIDNSGQSSSLSMVAKNSLVQITKNPGSGQSVNKSGSNPPSKSQNSGNKLVSGGQNTFLSEEEFNDYYEYSEDDEEIFPFIDPHLAKERHGPDSHKRISPQPIESSQEAVNSE